MPTALSYSPIFGLSLLPTLPSDVSQQDDGQNVDGQKVRVVADPLDQDAESHAPKTNEQPEASIATQHSSVVTTNKPLEFQPVYLLALIPLLLLFLFIFAGFRRNKSNRNRYGYRNQPATAKDPNDPNARGRFRKVSHAGRRTSLQIPSTLLKDRTTDAEPTQPEPTQPETTDTSHIQTEYTRQSPVTTGDTPQESKMDSDNLHDDNDFNPEDIDRSNSRELDSDIFDLSQPEDELQTGSDDAENLNDDESFDFGDDDSFADMVETANASRDEQNPPVEDTWETSSPASETDAQADDFRMQEKERQLESELEPEFESEATDSTPLEPEKDVVADAGDQPKFQSDAPEQPDVTAGVPARKGGLVSAIGQFFKRGKKQKKSQPVELLAEAAVHAAPGQTEAGDDTDDLTLRIETGPESEVVAEAGVESTIEPTLTVGAQPAGGSTSDQEFDSSIDSASDSSEDMIAELFDDDSDADYQFDDDDKSFNTANIASADTLQLDPPAFDSIDDLPATIEVEQPDLDVESFLEDEAAALAKTFGQSTADAPPDEAESVAVSTEVIADSNELDHDSINETANECEAHSEISDTEFVPGRVPEPHDEAPLIEDKLLNQVVDDSETTVDARAMMDDVQSQLDALRAENQSLLADLETARTQLAEAKSSTIESDLAETQDKVTALQDELQSEAGARQELQQMLDVAKEQTQQAQQQQQLAEQQAKNAEQQKQQAVDSQSRLQAEIEKSSSEHEAAKSELETARRACETAESELASVKRELEAANIRAEQAEQQAADQARQTQARSDEGMPASSLMAASSAALADSSAQSPDADQQDTGGIDKDDPFRLEPDQVKLLLKKLKHERNRRARTNDYLEEANRQRNEVERQLDAMRDELKSLSSNPAEDDTAQESIRGLTEKTESLKSELVESQQEIERLTAEVESEAKKKVLGDQQIGQLKAQLSDQATTNEENERLKLIMSEKQRLIKQKEQQVESKSDELGVVQEILRSTEQQLADMQQLLAERDHDLQELAASQAAADTTTVQPTVDHSAAVQPAASTSLCEIVCDELTELAGLGPATERKLFKAGITRFAQLASLSDDQISEISKKLSLKNHAKLRNWVQLASERLSAT